MFISHIDPSSGEISSKSIRILDRFEASFVRLSPLSTRPKRNVFLPVRRIIRRRGKASTSSTQLTIFHRTGARRRTNNSAPFFSRATSAYRLFLLFLFFFAVRRPPTFNLLSSFNFSFFQVPFPAFSARDKYFD